MKLSLRAISALCAVTVCSNDATRASIAANRANRLSMSTDATVRPIARLHPPHTYITRPPQLVDPAIQLPRNQDEVNEYLRSAGYKYAVRIEPSGDSYRMILEHQDAPGHLEAAGSHLSFGERNAFALV